MLFSIIILIMFNWGSFLRVVYSKIYLNDKFFLSEIIVIVDSDFGKADLPYEEMLFYIIMINVFVILRQYDDLLYLNGICRNF